MRRESLREFVSVRVRSLLRVQLYMEVFTTSRPGAEKFVPKMGSKIQLTLAEQKQCFVR